MSTVDDVKQKIDIVDVIGQYVTLKKAGRNFKALCPFHNEKTPSFMVFPDQGTWHCFGACGTGGDAFTFLMKKENIDFGEALQRLAQRAGVELARERPGEDAERKRLRELLAAAAAHYHYLLKNHAAAQFARDYIAKRFITPETSAQFQLGFALDDWHATESFLVGKGYSIHDLEAAGLAIRREGGGHYDRFRGRLMFPIRNRNGEVIGFGARTLTGEEPKYLNSPQTALFDKSATLYGLDLAKDAIRSQNLAVIVEGYMDVIGAHQGGFKNVVASLGTALTEKQLALLKRLTKRYALALDPDAAGEEATKRGLQVAREAADRKDVPVPIGAGLVLVANRLEAELLAIPMPPGKDPDELIHEDPGRWTELVNTAVPLVDFYFRALTQDLNLQEPRDKSVAVERLVPVIEEMSKAAERAHYMQQLARLAQMPEKMLEQEISARRRLPRVSMRQRQDRPVAPATSESKLEEYCLTLALRTPQHLARIAFLDEQDLTDPIYRALFSALRARQAEHFDRDAFRAHLDPALGPVCDRLLQAARNLPELTEPDLQREIETASYRLRLQRDRNELAQIEVMLRDRDEERTASDESLLKERVALLLKRVGETQKALSARTLFKPRLLGKTGTI
ncbi:MAG: DNA primase [Chloroflexi bacterium]|nr:DNA primase [Chloroflexota bacterium]